MSDPVLWLGVGGLAAVVLGPYAVQLIGKIRGKAAVVAASVPVNEVPSRYRWTEQEVDALKWAAHHLPASITVTEFLSEMYVGDMVGETCVLLLSPVKEPTT